MSLYIDRTKLNIYLIEVGNNLTYAKNYTFIYAYAYNPYVKITLDSDAWVQQTQKAFG